MGGTDVEQRHRGRMTPGRQHTVARGAYRAALLPARFYSPLRAGAGRRSSKLSQASPACH
eukprot:scaffold12408_cov58-Phaeocystis_antarctica.AAC.2